MIGILSIPIAYTICLYYKHFYHYSCSALQIGLYNTNRNREKYERKKIKYFQLFLGSIVTSNSL